MRPAAVVCAVVVVVALGCSRRDKAASSEERAPPPPLSAAAAAQVRDACAGYVAHVCGCAATSRTEDNAADIEEFADQCMLAEGIPGALELAILGAQMPRASAVDAEGLLANVGKIQKNCVEKAAALELRCPRAAKAPTPTPAAP